MARFSMQLLSAPTVTPRRRALVADDEPHVLRLAEVNLRRAGYEVLTASTPAEALDLARQHLPDLLIVDSAWRTVAGTLQRELPDHPFRIIILDAHTPPPL
jgi:DNA-binding response OmpR family regulator